MTQKKDRQDANPATLMEGVGRLFGLIMLLLRGAAILAILFFVYKLFGNPNVI